MHIVRGHTAFASQAGSRAAVVVIGNFDGVHRGHAHLFGEARRIAAAHPGGARVVALTFDPHPAKVLAPELAPPLITPLARKLELLAPLGLDTVVVEPFTAELAAYPPERFVDELLVGALGAVHVCVGYDFTFGRKRSGTTAVLQELGRARGLGVTVVPAFSLDGLVCSSTKVREFVLEGRVDAAARILGRDPELEGLVVHGAKRGRAIGIPTANLELETELVPKNGIYAGFAERLGPADEGGGARWVAAINIGTNPTFVDGTRVSVEAHLLDVDVDLYGARLRLELGRRLRDEERYATVDALIEQIQRDIEDTRAFARARAGGAMGERVDRGEPS